MVVGKNKGLNKAGKKGGKKKVYVDIASLPSTRRYTSRIDPGERLNRIHYMVVCTTVIVRWRCLLQNTYLMCQSCANDWCIFLVVKIFFSMSEFAVRQGIFLSKFWHRECVYLNNYQILIIFFCLFKCKSVLEEGMVWRKGASSIQDPTNRQNASQSY